MIMIKSILISILLSSVFSIKIKQLSKSIDIDECGDASTQEVPINELSSSFSESYFHFGGAFASCFKSSANYQHSSYNETDYQQFVFNKENDGQYSIKSTGKNVFLTSSSSGKLLCISKTVGDTSKFTIKPISNDEFYLIQNGKYVSAANPLNVNLLTSSIPSRNETFYWTSIPHQQVQVSTFLSKSFCKKDDCSIGALKFKSGLYFNPILHACVEERTVLLFGYKDNQGNYYVILGYGNSESGIRYVYITPKGSLDSQVIQSRQRYSLFKLEFKTSSKDSFYLKGKNGKYLCHNSNLKLSPVTVQLDEFKSDSCLFSY